MFKKIICLCLLFNVTGISANQKLVSELTEADYKILLDDPNLAACVWKSEAFAQRMELMQANVVSKAMFNEVDEICDSAKDEIVTRGIAAGYVKSSLKKIYFISGGGRYSGVQKDIYIKLFPHYISEMPTVLLKAKEQCGEACAAFSVENYEKFSKDLEKKNKMRNLKYRDLTEQQIRDFMSHPDMPACVWYEQESNPGVQEPIRIFMREKCNSALNAAEKSLEQMGVAYPSFITIDLRLQAGKRKNNKYKKIFPEYYDKKITVLLKEAEDSCGVDCKDWEDKKDNYAKEKADKEKEILELLESLENKK